MAFLFNTVVVTFAPLVVIEQVKNKDHSLQVISGVSTWWDFGAALGAFVGIYAIEKLGIQNLFLLLSTLISITFISYILQYAKTDRSTI